MDCPIPPGHRPDPAGAVVVCTLRCPAFSSACLSLFCSIAAFSACLQRVDSATWAWHCVSKTAFSTMLAARKAAFLAASAWLSLGGQL